MPTNLIPFQPAMLRSLPIVPISQPVSGAVTLPGSKSITNRALLLAAMAEGTTRLENALFSEDTLIMIQALKDLGFSVRDDQTAATIEVDGQGGVIPVKKADLHVGNAGTAARFLTAFCAVASRGRYRLDGVPQMRHRPMAGLVTALRRLGVRISASERESFPLEIETRGLRGGEITIDAQASSQMLSALLLVAPLARADLRIQLESGTVSRPFVNMTEAMMHQFGQPFYQTKTGDTFSVTAGNPYRPPLSGLYPVEGDATAASYFLALPTAVGGEVLVRDMRFSGLQGDVDFAEVLAATGTKINAKPEGLWARRPAGTARPKGVDRDFTAISDTFLTLAAIAPLLDGPTRISGIAHTRKQETDRVHAMSFELRKLGQGVRETEDSLEIHPAPLIPDVEITTYNDHRVAMSFAILGSHDLRGDGKPWLNIKDPGCCAKTFPHFFDVLGELRCGNRPARSSS